MSEFVCKGAWALGSACGECSRCRETALDGARALSERLRQINSEQRRAKDISVASRCVMTAERVQYRIDRAIERDGSREAAVTGPGMGLGVLLMEEVTSALRAAARAIDPEYAVAMIGDDPKGGN